MGSMTMLDRLASAIHDGPLGADDYTYNGPSKNEQECSAWCRTIATAILHELLTPTEGMVRAALKVRWPATYRDHLRHPMSGPGRRQQEDAEINEATVQLKAAIQAAIEGE